MANKKILFAEHQPLIAEIITPILRNKGYEVNVATDRDSLFKTLSINHPDLIIIDANLPGEDGFGICKILKSDFTTSYIPIIVLIDKIQARKKILEIEHGIDDYLIKPPDPINLEIRIEMALRRTEHQVRANSLTKLPGSREIDRVISDRINCGVFSFAYIDIDNFKYFNDAYGYFKGDAVIIQLAHIISTVVKQFGNKSDFVGHIGGDDFVYISTPGKESFIASKIISEFDRLLVFHYNQKDRGKGFLIQKDRTAKLRKVPLMSISIAIVNNEKKPVQNIIELTEISSEIKKYLKSLPGSNFLVNRRSIKKGYQQIKSDHKVFIDSSLRSRDSLEKSNFTVDKPLGQTLLDKGLITEQQLSDALRKHWLTTQRLGQIVINMGLVSQQDLEKLLEKKQETPLMKSPKVSI